MTQTTPTTCPTNPTTYAEGDRFGFYGVAAYGSKREIRLQWDERVKVKVGSRSVATHWLRETFPSMAAAERRMYELNCNGPIQPPTADLILEVA